MELSELRVVGWATVPGIRTRDDLLELGRTMGTLAPAPNGHLIKEIRVMAKDVAAPGSQSARHGKGSFPLHSDTVFWPVPARYVIPRASGDTRRPIAMSPLLARPAPPGRKNTFDQPTMSGHEVSSGGFSDLFSAQ